LCGATLETHLRRSIKVKFVGRVGKNDRTNIPAFHDQIVALRVLVQFLGDNLANHRELTDARNPFVYTVITQVLPGIHVIDQNARLIVLQAACDLGCLKGPSDTLVFFRMDFLLQDVPGDRSINGARINVHKSQFPSERSCDTAFSRGRRAINGDYPMKLFPHPGN
jgi:hypothetical protein